MSVVRIHENEEDGSRLPRLCVRCGEPATDTLPVAFAWVNPWIYVLIALGVVPFLIAMLFARKTALIHLPTCARHVNHWRYRQMRFAAGLLGVVALVVGGFSQADKMSAELFQAALIGAAAAVVVWLVAIVVGEWKGIRARRMTDHWTDLTNVSEGFAAALDAGRPPARRTP